MAIFCVFICICALSSSAVRVTSKQIHLTTNFLTRVLAAFNSYDFEEVENIVRSSISEDLVFTQCVDSGHDISPLFPPRLVIRGTRAIVTHFARIASLMPNVVIKAGTCATSSDYRSVCFPVSISGTVVDLSLLDQLKQSYVAGTPSSINASPGYFSAEGVVAVEYNAQARINRVETLYTVTMR